MIYLPLSLLAWNKKTFNEVFKQEVYAIDANLLPLQKGLRHSSIANGDNLSINLLNISDDEEKILVKAGLFYTGIIAGCNCADDPTPIDENIEYCEVLFQMDKITAETIIVLVE